VAGGAPGRPPRARRARRPAPPRRPDGPARRALHRRRRPHGGGARRPRPRRARRPAPRLRAAPGARRRDFTRVVGNPGWSGFRQRPTPGATAFEALVVEAERLDDALPVGFRPCFVKVDVEGAELEVLEGALETLRRHRPVVAFEHGAGSADHHGTEPGDVHALLTERAGLRIYDLEGRGPLARPAFEAIYATGRTTNFVARS
jgi:hypothetical protein